ncbi:MAG: hypothetical protein ACNA7T_09665 [Haliea sp.]|jgi:hypothetical protein
MKISERQLTSPTAKRNLWIVVSAILLLTVILQLAIPVDDYFGIDGWIPVGALMGLGSCAAWIAGGWLLSVILGRTEDYYDD